MVFCIYCHRSHVRMVVRKAPVAALMLCVRDKAGATIRSVRQLVNQLEVGRGNWHRAPILHLPSAALAPTNAAISFLPLFFPPIHFNLTGGCHVSYLSQIWDVTLSCNFKLDSGV